MARVIVADDNGLVRWSLTQALSREGYEAIATDSPARTLEEQARHPAEVIITDYVFPESSGIETLRKIKTSMPKTHVIMITGYGSRQIERLARDIGAFDVFEKPFEMRGVLDAVVRALATPERRRGPRA